MSNKCVFIVILCFGINLFSSGHVIRSDNIDDLFISNVHFDLKDTKVNDNITYYSYHIHVYFLQQNQNQTNEATLLRNRFLDKFNVAACNDDCETWCPQICHWELNTAPIGYLSFDKNSSYDIFNLDHIQLVLLFQCIMVI
jgi:hypothetical protein